MSARGVGVRRLDHVNVWCRDIDENSRYMIDTLGFRISEQVLGDDGKSLGSWLHVTPKSYDLAYGRDRPGRAERPAAPRRLRRRRARVRPARRRHLHRLRRPHRGGPREARRPADVLPLRLRAGRQPRRDHHRRPAAARARLEARHLDARGAQARAGLGDADARELVRLRDAAATTATPKRRTP